MKALARALRDAPDAVPYGEVLVDLLDAIFSALSYCSRQYIQSRPFCATDGDLRECFVRFEPDPHGRWWKRPNPHLREGLGSGVTSSRLAALVVWRFKELQRHAKYSRNQGIVGLMLPSPLSILFEALTVPDEPASIAYALAACRRLLFIRLGVYPSPEATGAEWKHLAVDEIEAELDGQRRYFRHRDNIPRATNKTAEVLQQFLAMKGHYCLRFGTWKRINVGDRGALWQLVRTYLTDKDLTGKGRFRGISGQLFEFRRSPLEVDPPRARDILNEIVGIPIPIRGAETLLFGGLRPSVDGSIVVNVSGGAGTGKTSFALALAATLSPFGTKCYYITTEEAREDLKARLKSVTPSYLRYLSIYKTDIDDWFHLADLRQVKPNAGPKQLGEMLPTHLEELGLLLRETRDAVAKKLKGRSSIPAIAPLVVVIDSVFGLTEGREVKELELLAIFIDRCRDLKALVIVLSGEELPRHSRLSYMVDVLLKLNYRDTDTEARKPERTLQLLKTRFQLSRPGTHVFHMSGPEGLRISPQLPSQLDDEEQRNLTPPDADQVITALNDWSGNVVPDPKHYSPDHNCSKKFLDLYVYSHILIHGHGSSGKAGIGLRILSSRIVDGETFRAVGVEPRRVLVVSFLYPPSYYEERFTVVKSAAPTIDKSASLECIPFSPGFLPPEDMVGKIARKIDAAELEGRPFTGVLLDGLHNVFLSFPVLQDNEMVWPTLYRMLSIRKQTIVTTHTTFLLDLMERDESPEEREVHRKGQALLLHGVVQSADFYLSVDKTSWHALRGPAHLLRVREFVGNQRLPQCGLLWDKEKCRFSSPVLQLAESNKPPHARSI